MKRIQTACLHQTIHFQLKDNVPAEIAQRLVREEEKEYQENLNRRGVPYRIWNREVLPDGSIRIRITRQLNDKPTGDFLNKKPKERGLKFFQAALLLCAVFNYLHRSQMTWAYILMVTSRCFLRANSSGPCMLLLVPSKAAPKETPPSRLWT